MLYNYDDLSFNVLTIDRFYHKEGKFKVKERPYAALSYREKGSGEFVIGGKRFVVNPGDVLFLPADTPYEVDYSVSESIVANLVGCSYYEPEVYHLSEGGFGALFLKLLTDWQDRRSHNRAKSTIFKILEKIEEASDTMAESGVFLLCLKYVEEHYCDINLDLESVCRAGFISPSSLDRLFTRHLGISPKQYIIKLRMNKALSLLIDGNLSVKEIALECGFRDEKYFSRAIKHKYGYPPSELRDKTVL